MAKKRSIAIFIFSIMILTAHSQSKGQYADVNGIKMYYELHGTGSPLVLIHGGGSTIKTTFGKILPMLAKSHTIIAVELQAHGHTSNRPAQSSFEQDADDVTELLRQLKIDNADIFGFSNGGNTAMQIAIRHPERARKLILASTFYQREGMPAGFWEGMSKATFESMPQIYKDEFLKVNNNHDALLAMFNNDARRMQKFQDWKDEDLKSIKSPALVLIGDQDIVTPEHAAKMSRLITGSRLAVIPGTHGSFLGEILTNVPGSKTPEMVVELVEEFLK